MNERPSYGDSEAKRFIERAAVIDAEKGRLMDAQALREIAAAAEVSPLAVDRVLEEHESTTLKRVPFRRRHPAMLTIAAMATALVILAPTRMLVPA